MIHIRSLLYLTGQVLSSIVVCTLAAACFFLSARERSRLIGLWAGFNVWSLRVLCGASYEIEGVENIPREPSVVLSNHQSAMETLLFQRVFPLQSYVLKRELLWIPFFGWGLAMNRPVAIDRTKRKEALGILIREGLVRLREGRWLVVFPEGSRMPIGAPGEFQPGGAMIAAKAGCPVLPVAHNSARVWPKNSFLKYPGKVKIIVGKPIYTKGKKARDINRMAEQWMHNALATLT